MSEKKLTIVHDCGKIWKKVFLDRLKLCSFTPPVEKNRYQDLEIFVASHFTPKKFFFNDKARLLPCPVIMFRTQDLFSFAVGQPFDKDFGSYYRLEVSSFKNQEARGCCRSGALVVLNLSSLQVIKQ